MNKAKKPNTNNKGVLYLKLPPYRVANHEKILIPVGTAKKIYIYLTSLPYFLLKSYST